jgi:hypothetical protein
MTPDEEGFFQAILDNPDDDTPRLVYVWLAHCHSFLQKVGPGKITG